MKCRSCQAEIADKAIVCYRCGTPTADLAPVARRPPAKARWPLWPGPVILAIVVLAAWLAPHPADSPLEWIAWPAAAGLAALAIVWLAARRR